MNAFLNIKLSATLLFISAYVGLNSQNITSFKQNGKWGFKKGEAVLIEAQYDTTFGFDPTNKICLVGKVNASKRSINPLTKELKIEYTYSYINPKNEKIYIVKSNTDSTNEVSITKQTPAAYLNKNHAFAANVGGKKYLISKNGKTLINAAYDNINFTKVPNFYITETKDTKSGQTYIGLLEESGSYLIQPFYSKVSINSADSVIYCCTAGVKYNGSDDVYNYKGNKIHSSAKHIHTASKKHIVYKLFESENSFIVHDLHSGKEKPLNAEWIYYLKNEFLVILDGEWYFYDMNTEKRYPLDKKLIKYFKLDE